MVDIKDFFENVLNSKFQEDPSKAEGMAGTYVFDVSGDGGGQWTIAFPEEGGMSVSAGAAEDAGCTIKVTDEDFNGILAGELDATTAFMSGKLMIEGDMSMAMKLQPILAAGM